MHIIPTGPFFVKKTTRPRGLPRRRAGPFCAA